MLSGLLVAVASLGCGDGSTPTAPSPPPAPAPPSSPVQLTCPSPLELRAVQGQPAPLPFALPQAEGGTAPLAVTCTPAPGATAPVGDSTVTCTATDARQVSTSCSFAVRVIAAPVLQVDRILSIGDSLTFGTVSRRPLRSIPGDTYVAKLQTLLSERYFDQQPQVFNRGLPGEWAYDLQDRYGSLLRETNPQLIILLTGANDLIAEGPRAIRSVVEVLERLTRDAQSRGIHVMLSTLPPQRPGSRRGFSSSEVVQLNAQILGLCSRYRTLCADVYTAMGGDFTPLIGADGLHPTLAGYDRMAETYFDVIVAAFERPALVPGQVPTAGPGLTGLPRPD